MEGKRSYYHHVDRKSNHRNMKKVILLWGIVLAGMLASCGTSRKTTEVPMVGGLTGTDYLEQVIRLAPTWESVSGKVALTLDLGKKEKTRVNATLRLKRDEAIQLLVAPVLGIEVARLEISPEGILLLDRVNKRYVQVSFAEISAWAKADLDYNILQCLFLNELFLPGKARLEAGDAAAFRIQVGAEQALLQVSAGRKLDYTFRTSVLRPQLLQSDIAVRNTAYGLTWDYSEFSELEGRLFPQHMLLAVSGTSAPLSLDMRFSRLNVHAHWEARTEIPSRYHEVTVEEILKILSKQ